MRQVEPGWGRGGSTHPGPQLLEEHQVQREVGGQRTLAACQAVNHTAVKVLVSLNRQDSRTCKKEGRLQLASCFHQPFDLMCKHDAHLTY
jgi:hypothetical protein